MEESHDAHRTNRNVQTARTQVGGKVSFTPSHPHTLTPSHPHTLTPSHTLHIHSTYSQTHTLTLYSHACTHTQLTWYHTRGQQLYQIVLMDAWAYRYVYTSTLSLYLSLAMLILTLSHTCIIYPLQPHVRCNRLISSVHSKHLQFKFLVLLFHQWPPKYVCAVCVCCVCGVCAVCCAYVCVLCV